MGTPQPAPTDHMMKNSAWGNPLNAGDDALSCEMVGGESCGDRSRGLHVEYQGNAYIGDCQAFLLEIASGQDKEVIGYDYPIGGIGYYNFFIRPVFRAPGHFDGISCNNLNG